jgi:hypothetical protein
MSPDWENVVTPVVDYAVSRPEIDSDESRSPGGASVGISPRERPRVNIDWQRVSPTPDCGTCSK